MPVGRAEGEVRAGRDRNTAVIHGHWPDDSAGAGGHVLLRAVPGGLCLADCDVAGPAPADGEIRGVKDWAIDPGQTARLWELSAELTGVNAFAA